MPGHCAKVFPLMLALAACGWSQTAAEGELWQLRAMIAHDVTHGSGTLEEAARRTKVRLLFAGATLDHLVNATPGLDWATVLGAQTFVSTADCGHRIFACARDALTEAVRRFLPE